PHGHLPRRRVVHPLVGTGRRARAALGLVPQAVRVGAPAAGRGAHYALEVIHPIGGFAARSRRVTIAPSSNPGEGADVAVETSLRRARSSASPDSGCACARLLRPTARPLLVSRV